MSDIPTINASGIGNIKNNTNQIPNIGIGGPSIISAIDRPVVQSTPQPVTRNLELPIIQVPDTTIKYPVIRVPTQEEFDAAVRAEKEKQKEEEEQKNRGLPDSKPPELPPIVQQLSQQPLDPIVEIPSDKPQPTFTAFGSNINLPDPSLIATAGAVAVVTTAATIASTTVLNALKNAVEPIIKEATKNKFKIKIKHVKPVLHYVLTEGGHVDIFEYSAEGTRLVEQITNVEQYIRDQIEINTLYEIDNKIIIDDVIKDKFTKEGKERFKPLFAPAKKIAKKLSAKFSI
jgi:hypothetical protein